MARDIAELAKWLKVWLVPRHPEYGYFEPYLRPLKGTAILRYSNEANADVVRTFLERIDVLLYIENPCLVGPVNIVAEAKALGKKVVGIPMWEWWPENERWALESDALWAVTRYTKSYLNALSIVLHSRGVHHQWSGEIHGDRWGVNLNHFPFEARKSAKRFCFVNGNGGYKGRKGLEVLAAACEMQPELRVTLFSQKEITSNLPSNININIGVFAERSLAYKNGDVFIFPSYWEGLCHGIYEAQAAGAIVITTDAPPMNECGTNFLIKVQRVSSEWLEGKQVAKTCSDPVHLQQICSRLKDSNIEQLSYESRQNIEMNFDLSLTLAELHFHILSQFE